MLGTPHGALRGPCDARNEFLLAAPIVSLLGSPRVGALHPDRCLQAQRPDVHGTIPQPSFHRVAASDRHRQVAASTAQWVGFWNQRSSYGEPSDRDLAPSRKGLGSGGAMGVGGKSVAREVEEIGDLIVNGQKPLNLSR